MLLKFETLNAIADNEIFKRIDHEGYSIFSYRMANKSDFSTPFHLEMRGSMFDGERCICRPMQKFFNLSEHGYDINFLKGQYNNIEYITNKIDGSLISTFWDKEGNLSVKSKQSTQSFQALEAKKLIYGDPNLLKFCDHLTVGRGWTVNMEYVGPDNQIVLFYPIRHLLILNVRNNITGYYMPLLEIEGWMKKFGVSDVYLNHNHIYPSQDSYELFVDTILHERDSEGYVIRFKNPIKDVVGFEFQMVKVKNFWYLKQHELVSGYQNPYTLCQVILDENQDDLKLIRSESFQQKIDDITKITRTVYFDLERESNAFFEANKELPVKEFAIKGQKELPKHIFSLVMNRKREKPVNLKEYTFKYIKDFDLLKDYRPQTTFEEDV